MLSRMADALYWMARNLERAEDTARLIEINLLHLIEIEEADLGAAQWMPLLRITGSEGVFAQLHPNQEIGKDTVVPFLTQEHAYASSIHQCIQLARENARVVRDRISQEMWECINQMWLAVDRLLKKPLPLAQAPDFYYQIRNRIARFRGLTQDTMVRGEAFGFNRLGTYMERTDMTARILDVKYHILLPSVDMVGSALDYYQWTALLKSLSGLEAYRLAYHAGLRPVDVSEFIIFSPVFPRSLRFGLDQLTQALDQIGFSASETRTCQALTALCSALHGNTAEAVFEQGLHEFLQDVLRRIAALNVALQADCFQAHLGPTASL